MFSFNKAQDAIVAFFAFLRQALAKLFSRFASVGDETAKAIPILRVESKETLDAIERLADGVGEDVHGVAEPLRELLEEGRLNITIQTPGGDPARPWRIRITRDKGE